ncbi:helicase-related protein [Thalassospira alkalitolerans]|uniref:helicase-related protein n=1 Tax=Thalassospira alkalitolerans TaxID=1293890 RepID=UPI003AA9077B
MPECVQRRSDRRSGLTDIAARGIDVDSVSHVVNFELLNVPGYVHRIGRTARGGASGRRLRSVTKNAVFARYRKTTVSLSELLSS